MRERRPPRAAPLKEPRWTRRVAGEGTWPDSRCARDTNPLMAMNDCTAGPAHARGGGKCTHPRWLIDVSRYARRRMADRDEIVTFLNELLEIGRYPDSLP